MAKKTGIKKKEFHKEDLLSDKKKALDTALAQIEHQFGKGAVMLLGSTETLDVDVISTGSLGMDIALGVGGIPRGRITEIYGPESSGKTTVALSVVAQAQKAGGTAAFIDVEHALDPNYAKVLGVDIDTLLISQPNSGEQALEITEALVRSGAIDIIVLDSVAAMTTRAEIEGEMGDAHVGLQARLMSQAMRKLTGIIAKTNCAAIFINQIREKIGTVYGNPEVTPGGRALKFYASVRMDIRRIGYIKQNGMAIGGRTKCKVAKNKVAAPFKEAEFDLMYGEGISYESEVLDLAFELNFVKRSGSWFSYKDERLGQGRDNARLYLKEHPELCEELAKLVRENAMHLNMAPKKYKQAAGSSKKSSMPTPSFDDSDDDSEPNLDITPDAEDFEP